MFHIIAQPHNKLVHRTREDIKWLVLAIKKTYPQYKISNIHKDKLLSSEKIVEFLNELLDHEILSDSKELRFFLYSDDEKFSKKKKNDMSWINLLAKTFDEKTGQVKPDTSNLNIEDFETLSFNEKAAIVEELRVLSNRNGKIISKVSSLWSKVSSLYLDLQQTTSSISTLLSDYSLNLNSTEIKMIPALSINTSSPLSSVITKISECTKNWSISLFTASTELQEFISPIFRQLSADNSNLISVSISDTPLTF